MLLQARKHAGWGSQGRRRSHAWASGAEWAAAPSPPRIWRDAAATTAAEAAHLAHSLPEGLLPLRAHASERLLRVGPGLTYLAHLALQVGAPVLLGGQIGARRVFACLISVEL